MMHTSVSSSKRPRSAARKQKKKKKGKEKRVEVTEEKEELSDVVTKKQEEEESYLLQRQERYETNIATLLNALQVFEKEEELMADANEEMLNSVENLKRLNTALANSAERQRAEDANQMMQKHNTLETQLMISKQSIQQKDAENDRLKRKLEEFESLSTRQNRELVSLRGIIQELQRNERTLREDLQTSQRRAINAEKRAEDLHNQTVAIRLEKDSVTQRFLQLTRNLSAVAQGHSIMATNVVSPDGKVSPKRRAAKRSESAASKWTVAEVGEWLRTHGFEKYVSTFAKNSVDGDMLFDLTDSDLSGTLVMRDSAQREAFILMREALL